MRAGKHRLECLEQTEQIDFKFSLKRFTRDVRQPIIGSRPLRTADRLPFVQQLSRRLELLVLEQPTNQRVLRIFFVLGCPPLFPAEARAYAT